MANFIITCNISKDNTREEFETVLQEFGLKKQTTNQSTFFGPFEKGKDIRKALYSEIQSLSFGKEDTITIYYPKPAGYKADIGKYELKNEGTFLLNKP